MTTHCGLKVSLLPLDGAKCRHLAGRITLAVVHLSLVALGGAAPALAETIDFAALALGSSYTEDGFLLTTDSEFISWQFSGNPAPCMFVSETSQTNVLELGTGSAFDLFSIDLSEQNENNPAQVVEFTGVRADGSRVTQVFTTDGILGYQTFLFMPDFTGLARLEWDQMNPECFLMYDNIVAMPSPVSVESRSWHEIKALYSR